MAMKRKDQFQESGPASKLVKFSLEHRHSIQEQSNTITEDATVHDNADKRHHITACHEVFSIAELFEGILTHLRLKDLQRMQAVNKTSQDFIKTSKPLQPALWLNATPRAFPHPLRYLKIYDNLGFRLNNTNHKHITCLCHVKEAKKHTSNSWVSFIDVRACQIPSNLSETVMDMLVVQPPVSEMVACNMLEEARMQVAVLRTPSPFALAGERIGGLRGSGAFGLGI
ncbi:hypothetical protein MBLNU230_g6086t1 [Neophaeotheca triangularis]